MAVLDASIAGRSDVLQQLFDPVYLGEKVDKKGNCIDTSVLTMKFTRKEIMMSELLADEDKQAGKFVGDTALHICCKLEHIDCVRMILRLCDVTAELNVSNAQQLLPLQCTSNKKVHLCFFQELLQKVSYPFIVELYRKSTICIC